MEEIYIQIGENKYPIALNSTIQRQDPVDQSWPKRYHVTVSNLPMSGDITEYGERVFHEYLSGGKCRVTVYTGNAPCEITSRRKYPRNTRIQKVQAKRKALDLSQDGKCCALKTRKASLALRKAEQDWYDGKRAEQPIACEFERVPPRVAKKQAKDARRFYRSFGPLENDSNFLDFSEYMTREIVRTFALPSPVIGVVDQELAHVFAIPPGEIGEMYNGNHASF